MPIGDHRLHRIKPNIIRSVSKNVGINPMADKRHPRNTVPENKSNDNEVVKTPKPTVARIDKIEKIWDDEVVYLVGGGPSLENFDWNRLKGKKVIAINRAFQVLPFADVMYWTDARFYRWYASEITNFKGLKVTCRPVPENPSDVIFLKSNGANTIDTRPSYISHGNNSGYGAINLAVKLGAKRIYLLGYDMNADSNKTHWHNGYNISHNTSIYGRMVAQFTPLVDILPRMGVEVWNANPNSKLECFRKCTIDVAINNNPIKPAQ